MKVVDATQQLVRGWKIPASGRCVVAIEDERVVGVAGFYVEPNRVCLWSNFGDEVRCKPKTMLRAAFELVAEARLSGLPVHAEAKGTPESRRLLRHLGFRPLVGDVWTT